MGFDLSTLEKIEDSFPYEKIRSQQEKAITYALDCFIKSDRRFCIVEAGTGVGKSAIGVCVANYLKKYESKLGGSYFITTQKILQDQYEKDFSNLCSIKSSSNYTCKYNKKTSCAESLQLLRTVDKSSRHFKTCAFNCNYKQQKQKFLESPLSVTNFPYFLTEANYSGKIKSRDLLVIDEGHNIEAELSRFIEISVSEIFCKSILGIGMPQSLTQFASFKWIKEVYLPKAKSKLSFFERKIEQYGGEKFREKLAQFQKVSRQFDLLRGHVGKIESFVEIYNRDNWVFEVDKTAVRNTRKITFKPIDVSRYAEESLFRLGDKVLIMSATIIDKNTFCETLGIDRESAGFISIPSPFDKKNRPIIFSPVGSMSARNIDNTLPKLVQAVKAILDEHKGQKGIIHCKTFKIAHYLKNNIKNKRLLIHDSTNRDQVLNEHIRSKSDTVLLSPSMSEGVDLKDDASRFQVICKVPYPYLGDKLVKKRMNKFPGWYSLQTAKSIIQSAGRSIRNEKDYAVTYILDQDFDKFYRNNQRLFSRDFRSCMV